MKTIAQQLKIKDFPFEIKDKDGNTLYYENCDNDWSRYKYGSDSQEIHFENSNGFWVKSEYDNYGNRILYEDSNGKILDNRPKIVEVTLEDIAKQMGISIEQLRIKD